MTESISEEIERGLELVNEGRIEEALILIKKLAKVEALTEEEKLRSYIIKGNCLNQLGRSTEALELGERVYKEGIRIKKPLLSIDGCFTKFWALFNLGRRFKIPEEIKKCEKLLKSILGETDSEIIQREAGVKFMKGYFLYWKDEYDEALNYFKEVLPIIKQSKDFF